MQLLNTVIKKVGYFSIWSYISNIIDQYSRVKLLNIVLAGYLTLLSAFTVVFDVYSLSIMEQCCVDTCVSECSYDVTSEKKDDLCYPCIICAFLPGGVVAQPDFRLEPYLTGEIQLITASDILVNGFKGDNFHPPEVS